MAGYFIYSLDWPKFRQMVEKPTQQQLARLTKVLAAVRQEVEDQFEDDDPVLDWPTDAKKLTPLVRKRLALKDWYGDLSDAGKHLWERSIECTCSDKSFGYRVDADDIYWDVMEIACKALKVKPDRVTSVALSAFGNRPFRYLPPNRKLRFGEWRPIHSMHPPDEVEQMVTELKSVEPAIAASGDEEVRRQYDESLLPSLTNIAKKGRMLYVSVDT